MRSFLRQFIIFSTILFFLSVLLFTILDYSNNKSLSGFTVNKDAHTIFIGDSHVQLGIDDKLLPGTVNLAQLSESYKFSFLKLQTILKRNPSVNKVYVGFSYNSLSSGYDDFIYGKNSKEILGNYFFLFPFKEKIDLLRLHSGDLFPFLQIILFNGVKNLFVPEAKLTFLGHYENDFQKVSAARSSMDKRVSFQFYEKGKQRDFSATNLSYLHKIIELCKERNVEVFLLNTPLHPYYKSKIPFKFIEKYNSLIVQNDFNVIDLNKMPLDDSCFIPDGDHVSVKGAVQTANELKKIMGLKR